MDGAEKDLRNLGVVKWKTKAQEQDDWRKFPEQAKTHKGSQCQYNNNNNNNNNDGNVAPISEIFSRETCIIHNKKPRERGRNSQTHGHICLFLLID
jgi:hypothetical protein